MKPIEIANIEPIVIRHLVQELDARCIGAESALAHAGIKRDDVARDGYRVSYRQTRAVITQAIRLLGDPCVGLRLGVRVNLVTWDACYLGLMACADSHELLAFAAEFLPPSAGLLTLRFEVCDGAPTIEASGLFDDAEVTAFLVDKSFAALATACRSVLGPKYNPSSVALARGRPGDAGPYVRAFGCPVAFEGAANVMSFPAGALAVPTANAIAVGRARESLSSHRASVQPGHELGARIASVLRRQLHQNLGLAEVAFQMNTSERTLRRRLAAVGIRYSDIVDRERRSKALSLLKLGRASLGEIAVETGFSDARSLRRAVKRWTGQSPTELQQER